MRRCFVHMFDRQLSFTQGPGWSNVEVVPLPAGRIGSCQARGCPFKKTANSSRISKSKRVTTTSVTSMTSQRPSRVWVFGKWGLRLKATKMESGWMVDWLRSQTRISIGGWRPEPGKTKRGNSNYTSARRPMLVAGEDEERHRWNSIAITSGCSTWVMWRTWRLVGLRKPLRKLIWRLKFKPWKGHRIGNSVVAERDLWANQLQSLKMPYQPRLRSLRGRMLWQELSKDWGVKLIRTRRWTRKEKMKKTPLGVSAGKRRKKWGRRRKRKVRKGVEMKKQRREAIGLE